MGKMRRSEEWWALHPERTRCSAHYKSNGQQCRVDITGNGTNVCNQHGALIPAVQAKAATRIQMSVDDAVKRLQAMLDDPSVEARDKIKILHDLLDRGGLGATSKHLVGVVSQDPVEQLFARILDDANALAAPAPPAYDPEQAALNARADGPEWEDVVDAEVVDEEPPRKPPPPARELTSPLPPKHIRDEMERLGLL